MKPLRLILLFLFCGCLIPASLAQHWEWVNPVPSNSLLSDIWFMDSQNGIICGQNGTILKTTDGGVSWHARYSGITTDFCKIWMTDANTGFIIGGEIILKTTDGGETWDRKLSPTNSSLNSVHFPDANTGYIVGNSGLLLKTINGGDNWSVISGGLYGHCNAVWFLTANNGFILTRDSYGWGQVWKTTDGGLNWTGIPNSFDPGRSIRFINSTTGFASDDHNGIYKTSDAGGTWTQVYYDFNIEISDIFFADLNCGYAVGTTGTILKTTDSGNNWTPIYTSYSELYASAWFSSPSNGWLLGGPGYYAQYVCNIFSTADSCHHLTNHTSGSTLSWKGLAVWGEQTVFVCGDSGMVYKSSDKGDSWVKISTGTDKLLNAVTFSQGTNIYAVGMGGNIVHSSDGGISWEQQSSGTVFRLNAVLFTSANTGFVAGDFGTLLKTVDGGITWSSINAGILDHILTMQFLDNNTGYIAGAWGNMFKTTDGGASWTKINSGTGDNINCIFFLDELTGYEALGVYIFKTTDGGLTWSTVTPWFSYGNIPSLYFTDTQTGLAVGEYGSIYLTSDGGQNWVSQVSTTNQSLNAVCINSANYAFAAGAYGTILRTSSLCVGSPEAEKIKENLLHIFPDPASDNITIQTGLAHESSRIVILNNLGAEVLSQSTSSPSIIIDIRSIPPGIYFVRSGSGHSMKTGKFIKR